MILVDISSIFHRMVHVSSNSKYVKRENGAVITDSFIHITKKMIFDELMGIESEFSGYGQLVICLDDTSKQYWRRDYFPKYKHKRKTMREESDIDWVEVYSHINDLVEHIKNYLPWKVVSVPGAEADDVILILAREYGGRGEKILIHSPDKDLIQAQLNNPNVKQYSALTKKWIVPENKHDDMNHWLLEHVCLGDSSDCVPRVIDDTEFSENFIMYLKQNDIKYLSPFEFKNSDLSQEEKKNLLVSYNIYKYNKRGENLGKDIYLNERFGPSDLQSIVSGESYNRKIIEELHNKKKLAKQSGDKQLYKEYLSKIKSYEYIIKSSEEFLDIWLDSHPMYRANYERNSTLVLESGIPSSIRNSCTAYFIEAETKFNKDKMIDYCMKSNIMEIAMKLSRFEKAEELTAANCGW